MLTRLAHVCLHVANLDATIQFYHTILGLPIKFTFEKEGALHGVYFQVGNMSFIEAFIAKHDAVVNTGIVHFCLETPDIDAFISEVRAKGAQCTDKKLGCDQSWQAWLQDPDGNRFEVHQYTAESAQTHGGVVQVNW